MSPSHPQEYYPQTGVDRGNEEVVKLLWGNSLKKSRKPRGGRKIGGNSEEVETQYELTHGCLSGRVFLEHQRDSIYHVEEANHGRPGWFPMTFVFGT